jgi:hypothetical protein
VHQDDIVEEVRKVRREIEAECDGPQAFFERMVKLQERYKDRLVRRTPRKALSIRKVAV